MKGGDGFECFQCPTELYARYNRFAHSELHLPAIAQMGREKELKPPQVKSSFSASVVLTHYRCLFVSLFCAFSSDLSTVNFRNVTTVWTVFVTEVLPTLPAQSKRSICTRDQGIFAPTSTSAAQLFNFFATQSGIADDFLNKRSFGELFFAISIDSSAAPLAGVFYAIYGFLFDAYT